MPYRRSHSFLYGIGKKRHVRQSAVPEITYIEAKATELERYVHCYLCNLNVRYPKMCPNCMSLACMKCFRKYLNGLECANIINTCFQCERNITVQDLINCPSLELFAAEISHLRILLKNEKYMLKGKMIKGATLKSIPISEDEITS